MGKQLLLCYCRNCYRTYPTLRGGCGKAVEGAAVIVPIQHQVECGKAAVRTVIVPIQVGCGKAVVGTVVVPIQHQVGCGKAVVAKLSLYLLSLDRVWESSYCTSVGTVVVPIQVEVGVWESS